jgi:hypothetical protein
MPSRKKTKIKNGKKGSRSRNTARPRSTKTHKASSKKTEIKMSRKLNKSTTKQKIHALSCASGKILNPATNRCVLETGPVGKKILTSKHQPAPIRSGAFPFKPMLVSQGVRGHFVPPEIPAIKHAPTPFYVSPKNTFANARALYEIYEPSYRPPQWTLDFVKSPAWNSYARTAIVYYDPMDELRDVRQVVEQREPVNIGMNRHYNSDALQAVFGYRVGGYQTLFYQTGRLPPNVAIYSLTPFATISDESLRWDLPQAAVQIVNAHVINVTGYAFDSRDQVDYKFFIPLRGRDPTYLQLLTYKHKIVFDKIFTCARDLGSEIVVLSAFGLASFAADYPDKSELSMTWLGGFGQSLRQFLNRGPSHVRWIGMMGVDMPGVKTIVEKAGMQYRAFGFLPKLLVTPPLAGNLNRTLFVNAWDPLSMVGNGNFNDESLDGRIGRRSALAFLCWPPINPQIRYMVGS